jgi:hypothetical protein
MQQASLVAGDTLDFLTTVGAYPASAGWTLRYRLVPRTVGNAPIGFTAAASGDDYLVQVGPSVTGSWAPDMYGWNSWVEQTGARYQVDDGQLQILPDPAQAVAGSDSRSQARIGLDACMTALSLHDAGQAHVKEYSIGNRRMVFNTRADILVAIEFWRSQVAMEDVAASVAKGLGNPRRLFVRFSGQPAPSCFGPSYYNQ